MRKMASLILVASVVMVSDQVSDMKVVVFRLKQVVFEDGEASAELSNSTVAGKLLEFTHILFALHQGRTERTPTVVPGPCKGPGWADGLGSMMISRLLIDIGFAPHPVRGTGSVA
jgi:hypothetical protein